MRQVPRQFSELLQAKFDPIAKEALPKRWVELLNFLNEIERRQKQMLCEPTKEGPQTKSCSES